MNKYLKYGIMGVTAVALSALLFTPRERETEILPASRDYAEIVRSGVLRAITEYNSVSFHVKEDTIGGLHYELLHAFAKAKGLSVEITPEMSIDKRTAGIYNGNYDILANHVLVSSDRTDSLYFTHPILQSKQVLVQRKPLSENDSLYIHSHLDLGGKTIHIVKGSPSVIRIRHLSNEIGDTIYVQEIDKYGPEQLLSMVAGGDIDYTVCDEGIAQACISNLPELDIATPVSFTQFYSWGVNRNNTVLLDSLNAWLEEYKQTPAFQKLIQKYTYN